MMRRSQKVKALLTRNLLLSVGLCFAITCLVAAISSFDLEDQIFENQVSLKADQLLASHDNSAGDGAQTVTGLEMQYYSRHGAMPEVLAGKINPSWPDGEYEVTADRDNHYHVAVRTNAGTKSYLVFNARPYVRSIDQVITFIIFVALLGSIMLLIALFFLRRLAKRVSDPIETMAANAADRSALVADPAVIENAPREIVLLAEALAERDRRIEGLINRESQFNRDISHELRTPLSVAIGAAEILEKDENPPPALSRLVSALSNMRLLTEGILWLGRQPDQNISSNVWQNCVEATEINRHLIDETKVRLTTTGDKDAVLPVPDAVAQVIIGNLVRNAFSFTREGGVAITISAGRLSIVDTGIGLGQPSDKGGFGIGLSLTDRLCAHFGMELSVRPGENGGTVAMVSWPQESSVQNI